MYLNPHLSSVPAEERAALARLCDQKTFRRKEVVLEAGTLMTHAISVASGLLRVEVQGADGTAVTTEFIRQHEMFWEMSRVPHQYQASVTLIAALPTHVFYVPLEALRRLTERHPEVGHIMFEQVMDRMQQLRTQFRRVTTRSPEDVVARILHELTILAPVGEGIYDKRITQAVIASYAGLSREQVNKTMRELEARGLIKREEAGVRVAPDFGTTAPLSLEDFADTQPQEQQPPLPMMHLDLPPDPPPPRRDQTRKR